MATSESLKSKVKRKSEQILFRYHELSGILRQNDFWMNYYKQYLQYLDPRNIMGQFERSLSLKYDMLLHPRLGNNDYDDTWRTEHMVKSELRSIKLNTTANLPLKPIIITDKEVALFMQSENMISLINFEKFLTDRFKPQDYRSRKIIEQSFPLYYERLKTHYKETLELAKRLLKIKTYGMRKLDDYIFMDAFQRVGATSPLYYINYPLSENASTAIVNDMNTAERVVNIPENVWDMRGNERLRTTPQSTNLWNGIFNR